jgi:hypothetical protein
MVIIRTATSKTKYERSSQPIGTVMDAVGKPKLMQQSVEGSGKLNDLRELKTNT